MQRIAIVLLLPALARGADYYIDPAGDDANAGTSEMSSWKTLARAEKHPFQPGDRVYLRAGATWHESLRLTRPIYLGTFKQSTDALYATISGADESGQPTRDYCIDLAGSDIELAGLELTGAANPERGAILIWADRDRADLRIVNCRIADSRGRGIWIAGDKDKRVERVEILNCQFINNDGSGIQASKLSHGTIAGNLFSGNCRKPVDEWQAAIRVWSGDVEETQIFKNVINRQQHGLKRGAGMGVHVDEVGAGVRVDHNDIFDTDGSGILVENTRGVEVDHNFVANADTGIFAYRAGHELNFHHNTIFARELGIVLQGHRAGGVNAGPEMTVSGKLFTANRIENNTAIAGQYASLKLVSGAELGETRIRDNAFGPPRAELFEWGTEQFGQYADLDRVAGETRSRSAEVRFERRPDGSGWERAGD